jgi:Domain of Unknown Function (DUF1080)
MMISRRMQAAVLALALAGCSLKESSAHVANAEWRSLIDPSLSAWRGYKQQGLPKDWTVQGDSLLKLKPTDDLISKEEFGDFELEFSWKLEPGGNAGVFYRGNEANDHIYWSAPEYQLLDDSGHADGRNRLTAAGSFYGMYPAPAGIVHRAGEWNRSRIVARGPHVEHWLNGTKLLDAEIGSADWDARLKKAKFAAHPGYARLSRGHLGIQGDHTGVLTLRAMRIRSIP